MPKPMVWDDDEQIIADLLKRMRRLEARHATQGPIWLPSDGYDPDVFTITGSGDLDHTLTYRPLGLDRVTLNNTPLAYTTDFTVDWTTGVVSLVAAPTTGDVLEVWYVTTGELIAASLDPETDFVFSAPTDMSTGSEGGSGDSSIPNTQNLTTTGFNPAAGTLLIVTYASTSDTTTAPTLSISDTIGGLTWTQVAPGGVAGASHSFTGCLWWAIAPGGYTGQIQLSTDQDNWAWVARLYTVDDVDTSDPVGGTGSVSVNDTGGTGTSLDITLSRNPGGGNMIFAFLACNRTGTITNPSGYTNLVHGTSTAGDGASAQLDLAYLLSGGSRTLSFGFSATTAVYQGMAIEIRH